MGKTLQSRWHDTVIRRFQKRKIHQDLESGRLNMQAARKFSSILVQLASVLEKQTQPYLPFEIERIHSCSAWLRLQHHQAMDLMFYYEMKNMLLGRCYDFCMEFCCAAPLLSNNDFVLDLKFDGIIKAKSVHFEVSHGTAPKQEILRAFHHPLILARVQRLDLLGLKITWQAHTGQLHIFITTLRGSCTWCCIPPVFQLIPLKDQDCIDLIELVQLIIHNCSSAAMTENKIDFQSALQD